MTQYAKNLLVEITIKCDHLSLSPVFMVVETALILMGD